MRLALVYDLRSEYLAQGSSAEAVAEFDSEETIDSLAGALARNGHLVERIGNGRALARRLAAGDRFDLVFSIAEGLTGRAREAQVPALCELFDQPYLFSDPLTLTVALDKGAAKTLVAAAGVATTPFVVIEPGSPLGPPPFPFPVFAKPLAEGTGKGCEVASLCHDQAALGATVAALTARFRQAVIIEPFLAGREFTVGIVGNGADARVVGNMEIVLNAGADEGVYSYRNKEACEQLVTYRKADDASAAQAAALALAAYRALGCRDAARLDLRCDRDGTPYFLEANPLAGLHPEHSDLPIAAGLAGLTYDVLIGAIVAAGARRLGLADRTTPARRTRSRPFVPVLHACSNERADEADTLAAAEAVRAALERNGYATDVLRFAPIAMDELAAREPLAVFNLVEAIDGRAQGALLAPWALACRGLAFTGNSFEALLTTASKRLLKGLLAASGIATPALAGERGLPGGCVIVKPEWEHASVGIDSRAVVAAGEAARAVAERTASLGLACFAEAYIDGREFNIALLDGCCGLRILPIQETLFVEWPAARPRVVDFEAKWSPDSAAYHNTPRRFGLEAAEPALAARLAEVAERTWFACGLGGYARIDMRVAASGVPYVIDVNANPGLGPDAGFVAAAAEAGIGFDALVKLLVEAAHSSCRVAA